MCSLDCWSSPSCWSSGPEIKGTWTQGIMRPTSWEPHRTRNGCSRPGCGDWGGQLGFSILYSILYIGIITVSKMQLLFLFFTLSVLCNYSMYTFLYYLYAFGGFGVWQYCWWHCPDFVHRGWALTGSKMEMKTTSEPAATHAWGLLMSCKGM